MLNLGDWELQRGEKDGGNCDLFGGFDVIFFLFEVFFFLFLSLFCVLICIFVVRFCCGVLILGGWVGKLQSFVHFSDGSGRVLLLGSRFELGFCY